MEKFATEGSQVLLAYAKIQFPLSPKPTECMVYKPLRLRLQKKAQLACLLRAESL